MVGERVDSEGGNRLDTEIAPASADPSNAELVRRCRIRIESGEFSQLIEEMAGVLERQENFAEGHFFVGLAKQRLGQLSEAAACFLEAVRSRSSFAAAYDRLFPILLHLDRRQELESALNSFNESSATGPDADALRGTWLRQFGRFEEARGYLRRAVSQAPERRGLHHHLGLVALDRGDVEEGETALRRAVSLDPEKGGSYGTLGLSLEKRGVLVAAARYFKQGLIQGDQRCAYPLTRILRNLNRFEESMEVGREANLDRLHFRSGITLGTLDRGGIVDLDGYGFQGASDIDAAEEFDAAPVVLNTDAGNSKWHYQAKAINFFPRSAKDFVDLKKLVDEHVISRSVPPAPVFSGKANILTMGSCFAGHLRKRLLAQQKSIELISVPEGLNNTFALRQFIEWSLTGNIASNAYWYDQNEKGGVEQWMPPEEHSFYLGKFQEFDGFVITIGLSEVWRDRDTGGVFWRGVPQNIYDENRHVFQISSVDENVENMVAIIDLVRRYCGGKPIIFTLSPVPLIATHRTDVTCMLADSVSKSILRVAIDQVMRQRLEQVFYWPSFEIVRWASGHSSYAAFGDDDGQPRHVNDGHVGAIIDAFIDHFFDKD
jgi:tetratricopeptide (TPR) repeat protein